MCWRDDLTNFSVDGAFQPALGVQDPWQTLRVGMMPSAPVPHPAMRTEPINNTGGFGFGPFKHFPQPPLLATVVMAMKPRPFAGRLPHLGSGLIRRVGML